MSPSRFERIGLLLLLAAFLCGCPDPLAALVGVDPIAPAELQARLSAGGPMTLVDLRERALFSQGHIHGARSMSIEELDAFLASPEALEPIVTVCDTGILSIRGAAKAHGHGLVRAYPLSGGMSAWNKAGLPTEDGEGGGEKISRAPSPPRLEFGTIAQVFVVASAYVIKPLYMILCAVLLLWIHKKREADLRMLFWALLSFEIAEHLCMLNYLLFSNECDLLEAGHMLGMVGTTVFFPWALFLMIDSRLLHLTSPASACLAQRFCKGCWKRDGDKRCAARQLFIVLVPALAIVSLIPFGLPVRDASFVASIFGTDVSYETRLATELLEFRVFPALAILFLAPCFALLLRGERYVSKATPLFFLGLGFSFFSLLRFTLQRSFSPVPAWADVWEQLTEILLIISVGALLWILRRQLDVDPFKAKAERRAEVVEAQLEEGVPSGQ